MDGEVRHESPRLEQWPKDDDTASHSNTTRSCSSSSSTVQPGSSDSELCKLMSSGSLESLADDDGEECTTDTEGESYDQMDTNRCMEQMNLAAEGAGNPSADIAAEYDTETEDYGVVIEKRFQQLYGFKTPDNCCLLDDEWCNQVFQPSANVSLSWSNIQALDATAQEQFKDQYFLSAGHARKEKEMVSVSSFLQIPDNKSNECRCNTSQHLAESDKLSMDEIPGKDRTSQKPSKMLQPHESDDDIRNAVAREIIFVENFSTAETGPETSQKVNIINQTAADGWTATSENPQHKDSAQFALHGSQLLDRGNDCLQFTALTLGDDSNADVLLSNEWPITGELHNQPLEFLCLINELAIMNDFVVMSNLVDTRPLMDNDRFALGMIRSDRCTVEEIVSDETTDSRSTPVAQTASDCVKNFKNDSSGKILAEKQGNEICESTRSVTKEENSNTPNSSTKQPEEYEQNVSYGGDLKKASSECLPNQDSAASVQDQLVPANSKAKVVSNTSRNKQTKNNHGRKKEIANFSQITDVEKTQKNRGKSIGLAFNCQPPRHPFCSTVLTTGSMHRHLKAEDSFARGGGSEAKLFSDDGRILCEKRKTSQQQLTHKGGYCKHEMSTRHCSNKSENYISSTQLNGQQSDKSRSPVQENQIENVKLPPIRQNKHEIESGSNVMPSGILAGTESTRDLFEIRRLKSKGQLKSQHQHHRSHLLANLIDIPARKQQASRTALKLPSLSLQPTPVHKRSHPLAIRRPCTPPNRNVLEARAQWPQFYTSHPSDLDKGLSKRIALKDLPSLKKVPGFSYGVYE